VRAFEPAGDEVPTVALDDSRDDFDRIGHRISPSPYPLPHWGRGDLLLPLPSGERAG